jgi:hypothetical protein
LFVPQEIHCYDYPLLLLLLRINRKFAQEEQNTVSGVSTTRSEVCDVVLLLLSVVAAAENNRKFVLKEQNKVSGVSTTRSEVCDVVLLARECSDLLWKPRLSRCCILDICVSGIVFVAGENWWTIGKLKRLFGSGFFVLDLRFWKAAS